MLPTLASKAYQMVFINPGIHEEKKKKKKDPRIFMIFYRLTGLSLLSATGRDDVINMEVMTNGPCKQGSYTRDKYRFSTRPTSFFKTFKLN